MTVNDLAWRKSSYSGNTDCVEIAWRKSSYSASQTDCVEVGWHKSSYSASQTNCVEVANAAGSVAVRDSKNPAGGQLNLPRGTWLTFLRNH
jgi:hypothetical protein